MEVKVGQHLQVLLEPAPDQAEVAEDWSTSTSKRERANIPLAMLVSCADALIYLIATTAGAALG